MHLEEHNHCFLHFLASKQCLGHFWAPPFLIRVITGRLCRYLRRGSCEDAAGPVKAVPRVQTASAAFRAVGDGLFQVTESVAALTVTFEVSRYRKHANFGC